MSNQNSKAMPTQAYVMNSRTCKAMRIATEDSPATEMIYDVLNCYVEYYEKVEKEKENLMGNLQNVTKKYSVDDEGKVTKLL